MAKKKSNIFSKFNVSKLDLREKRNIFFKKTNQFIRRRPMASFLIGLGILFAAIVANSFLTPSPQTDESTARIKEVQVYKIGQAPRATFSAKIDKEGVIKIVAQTPGIVSEINVFEGQQVWQGNTLISLANNYQGGNVLSVQRQLAYTQYKNVQDTYDFQKDIINKQKEITSKTDENSVELRALMDRSIGDTRNLLNLNDGIIISLQENLNAAQTGGNEQEILQARQFLLQAASANSQLNQGLRSAEFQENGEQITNIQKDIALKQLDIQQKALDLNKESSRLQLALAQIAESSMYPAAPFEGIVQKVHVVVGQSVSPGTPLVTLAGTNRVATANVIIPFDVAQKVSRMEESTFYINNKKFNLLPEFISSEATDGLLNSVTYSLSDDMYDSLTDGQYVKVEIPIGTPDSIGTIPYLPIDIVFQTQNGAFVYIASNNKVQSRKVTLGKVVGSNVAISEGLNNRDQVILDRNVIEGEGIRIAN